MKHQIMVFVGNGFDRSVLSKYGKGVTTSYASFYSFFKYRYPERNDNYLIQQMEKAKNESQGKNDDWSDFEAVLGKSLNELKDIDRESIVRLDKDLSELQKAFSRFLNDVVDSDVIERISAATDVLVEEKYGTKMNYAVRSLAGGFIKDLSEIDYEKMRFHNRFDNNEELKYIFINFNYTSLLDNYIYLDKNIFNPEPYKTSDNNFNIFTNLNRYNNYLGFADPYLNLLPVDIYHPHGVQDVPKSLLFGIENNNYNNSTDERRIFVKSFWARDELRYKDKFNDTELFIIYGSSIGESDSWWWNNVYLRLIDNDNPAELIIYNYGNEPQEEIKDKFIKNCSINMEEDLYNKAKNNIYVVNFGKNEKRIIFMDLPDLKF